MLSNYSASIQYKHLTREYTENRKSKQEHFKKQELKAQSNK